MAAWTDGAPCIPISAGMPARTMGSMKVHWLLFSALKKASLVCARLKSSPILSLGRRSYFARAGHVSYQESFASLCDRVAAIVEDSRWPDKRHRDVIIRCRDNSVDRNWLNRLEGLGQLLILGPLSVDDRRHRTPTYRRIPVVDFDWMVPMSASSLALHARERCGRREPGTRPVIPVERSQDDTGIPRGNPSALHPNTASNGCHLRGRYVPGCESAAV